MAVRRVNDKFPDSNGNVDVGTVRSINDIVPDTNGNINIEVGSVEVLDVLDSTDSDKALSANMGKTLYDMADFISEELAEHKSEIASSVSLGHVRIDNNTIKIENDTKRIYVPNSGNGDPGLVNLSQSVLLSAAHVPSCLAVHNYADTRFISHNVPATPTQMGHVIIDNDTITIEDGVISATQVPGPQGIQGPIGPQGIKGDKGDPGNTGPQGVQGERGDSSIIKVYDSIAIMDSSFSTDGVALGGFVSIANPQNGSDPDNGKVYIKGANAYIFSFNMSGSQGVAGPQGPQGIQGVKGDTGNTGSQGIQGVKGDKGDKGDTGNTGAQGLIIPGESRQIKLWTGSTTVAGGSGEWTINYASAGFTEIRSVQVTLESNITAAADKPLGTYIVSKSTTSASGKAYKATSAGLLTAMQQVAADNGVIVHVLVIGH